MYQWIINLLGLIYPRRCPICHEIVKDKGKLICIECRKEVHDLKEPFCKKCGKPISVFENEYCNGCKNQSHSFDRGWACFHYSKKMKESMYYFKYKGRREYANFYVTELIPKILPYIEKIAPQVVVPVPIHKKRMDQRGYNQAYLIAKRVSKALHIPSNQKLVTRVENTKALKELDRRQRKASLRHAFQVIEGAGGYERILLVDDIYTTGSTMDAISYLLKKQGVKEVYFVVICTSYDY